jgi:hypothetical protein
MFSERRVVDNRVFLLGLDKLYRDVMKQHERGELLKCARRVAEALNATPADVPVEGYYAEDAQLTEYFRLVRTLQDVDDAATSLVDSLPEFQRLRDVTSAPLYGSPQYDGKLLPAGRDALSQALRATFPEWTVSGLTAAAYNTAVETDEISLVGLAARVKDAVVLTAVRESVVLYAEWVVGAALHPPRPQYVWKVDGDLAQHARRFIDTFNALFGEELPPPDPAQAERYWDAYDDNEIVGRCVRLGCDDRVVPIRHYHWAICRDERGEFAVQEFWKSEVWTTTRYSSALRFGGRCPEL